MRWPALLTGKQACEFLGVSEYTLRGLEADKFIQRRRIPTITGTKALRFSLADLERFVENLPVGLTEQPEQLSPTVLASEERRA